MKSTKVIMCFENSTWDLKIVWNVYVGYNDKFRIRLYVIVTRGKYFFSVTKVQVKPFDESS